jgi:hypothetical protein
VVVSVRYRVGLATWKRLLPQVFRGLAYPRDTRTRFLPCLILRLVSGSANGTEVLQRPRAKWLPATVRKTPLRATLQLIESIEPEFALSRVRQILGCLNTDPGLADNYIGGALCLAALVSRCQRARMPLLILGVGIAEPPSTI